MEKTGIILIGPATVGKSTIGLLLSKALYKERICLDAHAQAFQYYEAAGWSKAKHEEIKTKEGKLAAYIKMRPAFVYAVERILKEFPDAVIDFGAGHSHYDESMYFEKVEKALEGFNQVILLLPTPDLTESVKILRARSQAIRKTSWRIEDYDFITRWTKDMCNARLAKYTIYTEGKTPEETRDEVLEKLDLA